MRNGIVQATLSGVALVGLVTGTTANAIEAGKAQAASAPVMAASGGSDTGGRRGFLSGIFGCGADGSKQEIGAAAGTVLGGLLGNRIAGRGSRTLGTVLGGALGAAAGSALGCKLQKNDQAKAERAMEDAVATGKDQSWSSDETGASGRVAVSQSSAGASLSGISFAKGVEPAAGYTKVGASYVSTANANVRAAPGTSAKLLGSLPSGTRVWVPASVTGQPWLLVSEDGVGRGYVSNALLRREAAQTASNCKMVTQTVDVPGSGESAETYQACKGTDGQWKMTKV